MDHAREVDLIQTIDHDVRQLLEYCNALAAAGDDRPVLTLVGERLRDQLREVAELSGSLAALVSAEGASPGQARRRGRPAGGSAPAPHGTVTEGQAAAQSPAAPVVPLVIRLKPRLPRGAWRRKGLSVGAQRVTAATADESIADDVIEPSSAPVREPVYRLRKAGTAEPEAVAAAPREGRDALERLREFLKSGSADGAADSTRLG